MNENILAKLVIGQDYQDTKMLDHYFKRYAGTEVGRNIHSPDRLMKYIDGASQRVANSYGPDDGYDIVMARKALKDIYGINAYTPKGFVDQNVPTD